jgi:hypothetical protein
VLLAAGGRTVTAVDPAEASLDIAKSKDQAAGVRWVHGDATALPPPGGDLAVMTGNVPGAGVVTRRQEVTQVNLPFVSFRYTYWFASDGALITSESTLRFRSREEVDLSRLRCSAAGARRRCRCRPESPGPACGGAEPR